MKKFLMLTMMVISIMVMLSVNVYADLTAPLIDGARPIFEKNEENQINGVILENIEETDSTYVSQEDTKETDNKSNIIFCCIGSAIVGGVVVGTIIILVNKKKKQDTGKKE